MPSIRGLLALLGLSLGAADIQAQVLLVPGPNPVTNGGGILVARPSRYSSLSFGVYSLGPTAYYATPLGYNGINQVTIIYAPAPAPPQPASLPFLTTAPRMLRLDDLGTLDPELRPDPPKVPEQLPGGREAGVFKPLAPDNRDKAARPAPPAPPEKPANPVPPLPALGALPRPDAPAADPKVEGEQQLKLGREAFARAEYGRAVQRFRDAARRTPDDPLAYFLLGQSLFAAGRYPEAVEAIRVGVGLRPDWPTARFAPREVYGPNAADFADHLRRLREALDLLPDDAILLFLNGYELWFDGRQEEARPLFRRARPGADNPAVIDRFLGARPVL